MIWFHRSNMPNGLHWRQWRHQGGGYGGISPLSRRLCPHLPRPPEKKIAKISHFWQCFGVLPPPIRILPPRCPPQKNSGAATDWRVYYLFANRTYLAGNCWDVLKSSASTCTEVLHKLPYLQIGANLYQIWTVVFVACSAGLKDVVFSLKKCEFHSYYE